MNLNEKLSGFLALSLVFLGLNARAEEDQKSFQGTWILVASDRDGKSIPSDQLKARDVRMVFEDDRLFAKMSDKSVGLGTFTLDPTASPKTYDRVFPDGTKRLGIYKIDGKTLTICVADYNKDRPKDFGTAKGDGRTQVVYQREE